MAIPARGQAADTSNPTTVVGTGTAASCDFGHLQSAVTKGGIITFNCGSAPVTIKVTATLNVPTTKNTVIDGGNLVTLDGGGSTQILSFNSANWQNNENSLTIQHITLTNAKMTGTMAIPPAPQPACSQGWDDGQGGAIYMRDGNLNVIDSIFTNNQAAPLGPDTGGGAIYVQGSKHGTVIVGSVFTGNSAANGGAVGGLFNELDVYNSSFMGNKAVGHDNNNNDMSMCTVMNNGQYEIGSGGNGGALYSDGNSVNVILCGDDIEGNAAGVNAFGGGLFFTSNNWKTAPGHAHDRRHDDDREHRRALDQRPDGERHRTPGPPSGRTTRAPPSPTRRCRCKRPGPLAPMSHSTIGVADLLRFACRSGQSSGATCSPWHVAPHACERRHIRAVMSLLPGAWSDTQEHGCRPSRRSGATCSRGMSLRTPIRSDMFALTCRSARV